MSSDVPSWVIKAQAEIEEQKKEESQFFKLPEGETEILVIETIPVKTIEKSFGNDTKKRLRWQFEINVDGQKKTLEVGKILYRKMIDALAQGLNPMTIIRAGTDIHTSYGIKGLMKE